MSAVQAQWRRLRLSIMRSGGWNAAGALAALLLVSGAAINGFVVPRHEVALGVARTAADAAQRAQRRRTVAPAVPTARDPWTAVEHWRARLPASSERQPRLAALLALAAASGLTPQRTELRFSTDMALGVARYRVNLPLTGRYSALRQFAATALGADDALLLDSIRFTRTSAQTSETQADLTFSFLMRTEAAAEPLSTSIAVGDARP